MRFFKNIDMDKVLKNKKQIIILFSLGLTLILTIILCLLFANNKSYVATYKPLEEESQLNQNDLIASEGASTKSEDDPSSDLSSSESDSQQEEKKIDVEGISLSENKVCICIGQTKMPLLQCHHVMRPISPKNGPVVMKI